MKRPQAFLKIAVAASVSAILHGAGPTPTLSEQWGLRRFGAQSGHRSARQRLHLAGRL